MTDDFLFLMRLLAAAARDDTVSSPDMPVDWQHIVKLAQEQMILPLVAYAIKNSPDLSYPNELHEMLTDVIRRAAVSGYAKRTAVFQLLNEMEQAGIHAVLLKGFSLADLYAVPEFRVSADTDIFVASQDEKRACDFLHEKGFTIEPRWKNGHHSVCHHPVLGCVEVHISLYDELVEDVWFGKIDDNEFLKEPQEKINTLYGSYYAMGKTDYLLFLILHMIKHFIISGLSLRMMMDIALFYKANRQSIDIRRLWDTISKMKYNKLVSNILWGMIYYCQFQLEDFPGLPSDKPTHLLMVLDDLEQGGWIGYNEMKARVDGWHEYNRQKLLMNKTERQYKLYMIRWRINGFWLMLFPSLGHLSRRYSYIEHRPWLIPYAWFHRLIFRGAARVTNGIVYDKKKLAIAGVKRYEMFKKLDML